MSLQIRYCESCGQAWPIAEGDKCPICCEPRECRDAITVIHNLHNQLRRMTPAEERKP